MDLRARSVGDILTVLLVERTDASKESSTSTSKDTTVDTGLPIFGGTADDEGRQSDLEQRARGQQLVRRQGRLEQSNQLDGSITVTVAERLANGNLLVRGEKRITINQGEEYIRLQGIVRPVDIGPQQHGAVDASRRRANRLQRQGSPGRRRTRRAGSRGSSTRRGFRFERAD